MDPSEPKVIGSSGGIGPPNTPALLTVPMVGDVKELEPRERRPAQKTTP
jgi:hypothetical protein